MKPMIFGKATPESQGIDSELLLKALAAAENGAVRYWWTSPDGVLLMNSAAAGTAPESSADSAGGSDDEYGGDIERLFEEIGLDIRDFESLGFKGGDDEA